MPLTNAEKQQRRRAALAAVAHEHGYGGYSELLTAVLNGDAAVVRISFNDYDPAGPEMAELRRMAKATHPYTAELLEAVIRSLELALARRHELSVD